MKNMLVLSTVQPLLAVTKDDGKRKPSIIKLYDFTKIGTDIVDQRNAKITTKAKSSRWVKVAFSYVLDAARNNAMVVYSLANKLNPTKQNSFWFTMTLVKELIDSHLQRRSTAGLNAPILSILNKARDIEPAEEVPEGNYAPIGTRRRCIYCLDVIKGRESKAVGRKLGDDDRGDGVPTKKESKD